MTKPQTVEIAGIRIRATYLNVFHVLREMRMSIDKERYPTMLDAYSHLVPNMVKHGMVDLIDPQHIATPRPLFGTGMMLLMEAGLSSNGPFPLPDKIEMGELLATATDPANPLTGLSDTLVALLKSYSPLPKPLDEDRVLANSVFMGVTVLLPCLFAAEDQQTGLHRAAQAGYISAVDEFFESAPAEFKEGHALARLLTTYAVVASVFGAMPFTHISEVFNVGAKKYQKHIAEITTVQREVEGLLQ